MGKVLFEMKDVGWKEFRYMLGVNVEEFQAEEH